MTLEEPAPQTERPAPAELGERYELLELLGQGGMARVHRAHDRRLQRVVAVKLLPAERQGSTADTLRLQDEARAAAGLHHPNIIAVHDVGASSYGVYVVMELLSGQTWRDVLRDRGPQPAAEVATIGAAVASALAAAHAHGVVHRDVNPSNVMLLDDGTPKLMDFGIARIQDVEGLTESGAVVGTADYMSPEQVRAEKLDGRSDVYSLGCSLYEVLTGRTPFAGYGPADVAAARLREPPVPPRQVAPQVPVALEDVVLRAMALRPDDRPDAEALSATLSALAERDGGAGAPPPQPDEGRTTVLAASPATPTVAEHSALKGRTREGPPPDPAAPPPAAGLRRAGMALLVLGVLGLAVALVLLFLA